MFLWRPIDLNLIPQKLPFHLDFDLSGWEDGEAGTNLLSNYLYIKLYYTLRFQTILNFTVYLLSNYLYTKLYYTIQNYTIL